MCALLVALLAGCGGAKQPSEPHEAPAAQQPSVPASEDAPAAAPENGPAAAGEATPPAAQPISVSELRGRHGFDWLHPEATRCREIDAAFAGKLEKAGATCQAREPGESFGVDVGVWHSCAAGDDEWVIFATRETCVEMYETMMANAE